VHKICGGWSCAVSPGQQIPPPLASARGSNDEGSPLVFGGQGIGFDCPLTRLRDYIVVVRRFLRGETVSCRGETVTVQDAKLDFEPLRPTVPIYLGVTGKRALELAGAIGDGVILNGFVSAAYTRRAMEGLRDGADRAGRELKAIDITGCVIVSVDEDSRRAKDAMRPLVATYLATFPNIARESSVPESELSRIRSAFSSGGPSEAVQYITDAMVDELTCSGTPEECRACIGERRAAGLDMPILFIVAGDVNAALSKLSGA